MKRENGTETLSSLLVRHVCSNHHKLSPGHTPRWESWWFAAPLPTDAPRLRGTLGDANFSQRHARNHIAQLIYLLWGVSSLGSPRTQPPAKSSRHFPGLGSQAWVFQTRHSQELWGSGRSHPESAGATPSVGDRRRGHLGQDFPRERFRTR